MNWYFEAWKQGLQFSGRASREAFWMFFLVNCVISIAFITLEVTFQLSWMVDALYSVLVFIPMLALSVRRLHDTNRSVWWLAIVLVPAIGMVWLLVLLALPSDSNTDFTDHSQHAQVAG